MSTTNKNFFGKIDFNKTWDEHDWEKFFLAQDAYRIECLTKEIGKMPPLSKIRFHGSDEVAAFEPVMQAYGANVSMNVLPSLPDRPFVGDQNPQEDYCPSTDEDPHFWGEGAPLASVLIYRDACRFAICTSNEIDRHRRRRRLMYRKRYTGELESLRFHANWIAINVAQGHRIGYSNDRIQGNIAKCKRAIQHSETCMVLLGKLSQRTTSRVIKRDLYAFAVQLRNGLHDWMEELRLRVSQTV